MAVFPGGVVVDNAPIRDSWTNIEQVERAIMPSYAACGLNYEYD